MITEEGLTKLLSALHENKPGAENELAAFVHDELRAMARRHLMKDFGKAMPGATMQPTMLANDTLMKLIRQRQRYDGKGHFFALASRMMMRVLMDYHRERKAQKRGGGALKVTLDGEIDPPEGTVEPTADIEAVHQALDKLGRLDARKADVVRYRILWGMTTDETAAALGVSGPTVERDWAFAKAWLAKELAAKKD